MLMLAKPLPWKEQVETLIHLKQTSSAPNGGHTEFQVASIVSGRICCRKLQFLVK
jgi:hypothetical protein